MNESRELHTATLLTSGFVLVAGGRANSDAGKAVTEAFDTASGSWSSTGSSSVLRFRGKSILLPTGKVLSVGGSSNVVPTTHTELFDPVANGWLPAASLLFARSEPTATLLRDGSVLLAGESGSTNIVRVSERYSPTTDTWQTNVHSTPRVPDTPPRSAIRWLTPERNDLGPHERIPRREGRISLLCAISALPKPVCGPMFQREKVIDNKCVRA